MTATLQQHRSTPNRRRMNNLPSPTYNTRKPWLRKRGRYDCCRGEGLLRSPRAADVVVVEVLFLIAAPPTGSSLFSLLSKIELRPPGVRLGPRRRRREVLRERLGPDGAPLAQRLPDERLAHPVVAAGGAVYRHPLATAGDAGAVRTAGFPERAATAAGVARSPCVWEAYKWYVRVIEGYKCG